MGNAECSFSVALAGIAAAAFLFLVLRELGFSLGAAAFVFIGLTLHPQLFEGTDSGMEMGLVLAFISLSLLLLVRRKFGWLGVALGGLLLTRYDGIFWVAPVMAYLVFAERANLLKVAATLSLTMLPWLVFSSFYFGSVVPQTVAAKQLPYSYSLEGLLSALAPRRHLFILLSPWPFPGAGLLLLVVAVFHLPKRSAMRPLLLLAAYPPLFVVGSYLGRSPLILNSYFVGMKFPPFGADRPRG